MPAVPEILLYRSAGDMAFWLLVFTLSPDVYVSDSYSAREPLCSDGGEFATPFPIVFRLFGATGTLLGEPCWGITWGEAKVIVLIGWELLGLAFDAVLPVSE
jgi:hypothetical protein